MITTFSTLAPVKEKNKRNNKTNDKKRAEEKKKKKRKKVNESLSQTNLGINRGKLASYKASQKP